MTILSRRLGAGPNEFLGFPAVLGIYPVQDCSYNQEEAHF